MKFELKQWVLTTGVEGGEWTLCQYSHFNSAGFHVFVGGTRSKICIPFNEKTKHLVGTKDKWEETAMKTYKIRVTETLSRVVEVTAENEDEAQDKVEDMVNCEDIVLDADDFADREYYFEE